MSFDCLKDSVIQVEQRMQTAFEDIMEAIDSV